MATITEMKTKRASLESDIKYLANRQNLTTTEEKRFDSMVSELEILDADIKREKSRFDMIHRMNSGDHGISNAEARDLAGFSFLKFIREAKEGFLTGLEAEMAEEGAHEMFSQLNQRNKGFVIPSKVLTLSSVRASTGQNFTTAGDGGNLAANLPVMYRDALKNALVLPGLGATYLTGLTGKLPIVRGGLFSAAWAAEGIAVDSVKAAITKIIMEARRLTATGAFSQELLRQGSIDVENWVRMGLVEANAQAIMDAAINGLAANNQPVGILNTIGIGDVAGGANGLAPAWSHLVDLESKVAAANADLGSLGYLTNGKVRGALKQILKSAGVGGYIWDKNEINGYKAAVSNVVPSNLDKGVAGGVGVCSSIIFGNWADLMIGEWGGLDIVVDPYTLKKQGDIEITVHTFADIAIAHPESFAAMKDALTA